MLMERDLLYLLLPLLEVDNYYPCGVYYLNTNVQIRTHAKLFPSIATLFQIRLSGISSCKDWAVSIILSVKYLQYKYSVQYNIMSLEIIRTREQERSSRMYY